MRRKTYEDHGVIVDADHAATPIPAPEILRLRASTNVNLEFGQWAGKRIDPVVSACRSTLWQLKLANAREDSTLKAYLRGGFSSFLDFLAARYSALVAPLELADIDQDMIREFIDYLAHTPADTESGQLSYTSQKNIYTRTKAVLTQMSRQGLLPPTEELFPKNPYPNSDQRRTGERPLTRAEALRVKDALIADLWAVRRDRLDVPDSDKLIVYLLLIALRTGRNTSPLLELTRDSLRPHPIFDDRHILVTYKRRGNNTHHQAFRKTKQELTIDDRTSVLSDVVTLFNEVFERNQQLVINAAPEIANRLWLYRSENWATIGRVSVLNDAKLCASTKNFVERCGLLGDDGKPLKLNLSRLRKYFVNRIFDLSGDPIGTARAAGHSLSVAANHYWTTTSPEMERNFRFVGEIWVSQLRDTPEKGTVPVFAKTGVAACRDTLHGRYAPKDGQHHCTDFLNCFRCPEQVIVGDDLHKVFSFYWLLLKERNSLGKHRWGKRYAWVIRVIERDIEPQFPAEMVHDQKHKARTSPHAMWRDRHILGDQE